MKNNFYKKKKERKFEVNNDIKIIKYNINLLPHILNFIKKSVFTNRTKNTWIKNDMTSVNIRKGNKLLAVLPFEKIYLKIENKFVKVLWISAVSVLPKYRNYKLGSKMLQSSEKIFKKKFKYIFVMREKEKKSSKAFNWYKKNGFKKASKILSYEKKIKINKAKTYLDYFKKIKINSKEINLFLKKLKKEKKTIYAMGASTKGNVILQMCKLDNKIISGIYDVNPFKFGMYTPGTKIIIKNENEIKYDRPNYVLLLIWHFKKTLKFKLKKLKSIKSKYIWPFPKLKVTKD